MFEIETGLIFWNSVSFLILLFVMYRWALPPFLKLLRERQQAIAVSVSDAENNQKKSREILDEAKQKLAEAGRNAQKIVDGSVEEGEKMKAELLNASKKEANLMLVQAKQEIERERTEMLLNLRSQAADFVVLTASRLLKKKIDPAENSRLIEEGLKEWRT